LRFKARTGPEPYNRKYMSKRVPNDNPYTNNTSLPPKKKKKNMATPTLNNWKDSLPLGVAEYAKLINED